MKTMAKYAAAIFIFTTLILSSAQAAKKADTKKKAVKEDTLLGYKIDGDNVIFTFNVKDYASFDEVESITVAGEFNGWDPAAPEWQATDDDKDGIWIFKASKSLVPSGTKFKFVSNQVDWNQPAADKLDKKYLADDGNGGFNLVVLY